MRSQFITHKNCYYSPSISRLRSLIFLIDYVLKYRVTFLALCIKDVALCLCNFYFSVLNSYCASILIDFGCNFIFKSFLLTHTYVALLYFSQLIFKVIMQHCTHMIYCTLFQLFKVLVIFVLNFRKYIFRPSFFSGLNITIVVSSIVERF